MSAPQVDDEVMQDLKRDLQAIDALYPDDIEPPASADDAVRAAARRAVRAKPRGESFWWPHTPPLAAAAVLVLTVSIAFLAMDDPIVQELQREPDVPAARVEVVPAPVAAPPAATADAVARIAPPEPATQAARSTAPAGLARPAESAAESASSAARAEPRATPALAAKIALPPAFVPAPKPAAPVTAENRAASPVPPAPFSPPAPGAGAPVAEAVPATPPAAPRVAAPMPVPVPAAPLPAPQPARIAAADPPAPVSEAREPAARDVVIAAKDDPRLQGLNKKELYVEPPGAPAERAVGTVGATPKLAASPMAETTGQARATPAATTAAKPVQAPIVPAPGQSQPIITKHPPAALLQDSQSLPQLWLKRIQLMKSEGKVKEAEEELVKFRKRYPDYPLPEELKDKK